MAENRVIGFKGRIPWHLPEDFQWFKQTTIGGAVLMGRKTFESLGKPLPGRENVVLSRTLPPQPGVLVLRTLSELQARFSSREDAWIIGGAELYAQTLSSCTELYLSLVNGHPEGDAVFPEFGAWFKAPERVAVKNGFTIWRYRRGSGAGILG